MAYTPSNLTITKTPRPFPPAPASQNHPIHPLSLHYQCTFCGHIVIKVRNPAKQNPAPPIGTCLIKTGATWRHPTLGQMPHYIDGGACRYERMDLGVRRSPSPSQASKRVKQRRADDDQEVIALNDVAGQAPSVEEIQQQVLTAQMDNCPDSDTDLDWTSSDEEGPKGAKGKKEGKGKGKEGKERKV